MKGSASNDDPKPHRNWQRLVDVAYFRLLGWTQREAAGAVGIDPRTVREYQNHAAWPEAVEAAGGRWHVDLAVRARGSLYKALDPKDPKGDLALKVIERIDERLAPPKIAHELFGKGGKAIEITHVEHDVSADTNGTDPRSVNRAAGKNEASGNHR